MLELRRGERLARVHRPENAVAGAVAGQRFQDDRTAQPERPGEERVTSWSMSQQPQKHVSPDEPRDAPRQPAEAGSRAGRGPLQRPWLERWKIGPRLVFMPCPELFLWDINVDRRDRNRRVTTIRNVKLEDRLALGASRREPARTTVDDPDRVPAAWALNQHGALPRPLRFHSACVREGLC